MSFYPKDLDEEALKQRVANDFFAKFAYEPLKKIDFALTQKDDVLNIHYLLWAEAKKGDKASIDESFVQLILTIGVQKLHKNYNTPEFLGAFDCEKITFLPYKFIKDFLYRADFNWKIITPTKYQSDEFQKMLALTKDIFKEHQITFDFEKDNKDLKKFIKSSIAKGEYNPITIDKDNANEVYQKWISKVLPNINLKSEVWKKARKQNIALESDFFLADLISKNNVSLKENLRILLQKRQDEKDELYYKVITTPNDLFVGQYDHLDIDFINQDAHDDFWKRYQRPPKKVFWSEILERRDKLAPQDIMERKGAFYTPKIWAQKAQSYLESVFGKDWQDDYYIWDCAAGTGNLLKGLKNSAKIYASTLDLSDVLIMKELVKDDEKDKSKPAEQRLNLLEKHIFQFDFLNDDFSKLPQNLQDILNDEKKRQKLIIFINPPYAEAGNPKTPSGTGENKGNVSLGNKIGEKYKDILGKASNELFAQFLIRIYVEIQGCVLAQFSKLKIAQGQNFAKFRKTFKAEFKKGFCVPANTFDNVKGQFPIGFMIWDTKKQKTKQIIELEICDTKNEISKDKKTKKFYGDEPPKINQWLKNYYDKTNEQLAILMADAPDFQNNNHIGLISEKTKGHWIFAPLTSSNLIPFCVYFAVRLAIKATWLNDRDQFLYPNDKWQKDTEFHNDCLAFTLFHGQNQISSEKGINHFIPFLAKDQVGAKDSFKSEFMFEFINGKLDKDQNNDLNSKNDGTLSFDEKEIQANKLNFIPTKPLKFSKEAEAVFEAGREIWRYYHKNASDKDYNVNASLYDIKAHFQGRNSKGKMNNTSKDEGYNKLMSALNSALKKLAEKITPKIYEYGFLRE